MLKKQLVATNSTIEKIELGENFTLVACDDNKIYSFGDNSFGQLGREILPDNPLEILPIHSNFPQNAIPHKISACGSHAFLIDTQSNIYAWGENINGELGLGHSRPVGCLVPNNFLPSNKIKDIQSKGIYNVGVLENGSVILWPYQKMNGKFLLKPIQIPFPSNVSIASVSCGQNFVMYVCFHFSLLIFLSGC